MTHQATRVMQKTSRKFHIHRTFAISNFSYSSLQSVWNVSIAPNTIIVTNKPSLISQNQHQEVKCPLRTTFWLCMTPTDVQIKSQLTCRARWMDVNNAWYQGLCKNKACYLSFISHELHGESTWHWFLLFYMYNASILNCPQETHAEINQSFNSI
jgi:hypothetical protein